LKRLTVQRKQNLKKEDKISKKINRLI